MTVTPASIKAFAPEFSSFDDNADVQPAIDQAERRTNRTQWAGKADDGVTYLVCHLLTIKANIAKSGAAAKGPLTEQRAGPVARSFANPFAGVPYTQAWFAHTLYGQAYVELRALIVPDRTVCP